MCRRVVDFYNRNVFFFQAEDGIRDLVRSSGLGDVYKRQTVGNADKISVNDLADWIIKDKADFELVDLRSEEKFNEYSIPNSQCIPLTQLSSAESVSYTHLTLPTSDLV